MRLTLDDFMGLLQKPRRYESYVSGLCPYHEDTSPSLLVFADGWFRCLACEEVGEWERLHRKLQGWEVSSYSPSATEWRGPRLPLDDLEGFAWEAHEHLVDFPSLGWYLKLRGVESMIDSCVLGWNAGWYVFPAFGERRQFMGLLLRAGQHIQQATGKRYIIPKGQQPSMYVPNWKKFREAPAVAVVYGVMDALALNEMGFPVATVMGGKLSFKAEWLEDVRKPIYIIPDKDEEHAAMRLASRLGWRGKVIRLNYPAGLKDPADFLQHGKRDEFVNNLWRYFNGNQIPALASTGVLGLSRAKKGITVPQ